MKNKLFSNFTVRRFAVIAAVFVCVFFAAQNIHAKQERSSEGFLYSLNEDSNGIVINNAAAAVNDSGCVEIPAKIVGLPVVKVTIGINWDAGLTHTAIKIKSVILPNTVTEADLSILHSLETVTLPPLIYTVNFDACSSLKTIDLSSCRRLIGFSFEGCSALETVILPDNPNYTNEIPVGCFKNCTSLKAITFPPSIQYIGNYAFEGCSSLKELSIPGTMTSFNCGAISRGLALERLVFEAPVKSNTKSKSKSKNKKDKNDEAITVYATSAPTTSKITNVILNRVSIGEGGYGSYFIRSHTLTINVDGVTLGGTGGFSYVTVNISPLVKTVYNIEWIKDTSEISLGEQAALIAKYKR